MDDTENKCAAMLIQSAQSIYQTIAARSPLPVPPWSAAPDEDVLRCIEAAIANGRAAMEIAATARLMQDERRGATA
jgi:hypothetical protein